MKENKYNTQFLDVSVNKLHIADWNYKLEASDELYEKFKNSVIHDGSVGALAVREIDKYPKGHYEVIDGNHRLEVIQELNWKKVHVENFGNITQSEAALISYRRNHEWFEKDEQLWSKVFVDSLQELDLSLEEIESFVPDTLEELQATKDFLNFDWNQFESIESDDEETEEIEEDLVVCPKCKHEFILS